MGQDDELGGAALPRSAPRRDTTSGRGVGPARPQEDPVELAHLRAARREVRGGEVVLHVNCGRRPGEGLRALLAQVAEEDLLRVDVVREGRRRHGRRFPVRKSCSESGTEEAPRYLICALAIAAAGRSQIVPRRADRLYRAFDRRSESPRHDLRGRGDVASTRTGSFDADRGPSCGEKRFWSTRGLTAASS